MIEPGGLNFSEEEVVALRRYLLNGGFMMVDDFWGDYQWENFYQQIKRVFPNPRAGATSWRSATRSSSASTRSRRSRRSRASTPGA